MKTLYRPVGLYEMKLILDLEWKGFPPRLPEQPIFYPVLNQPYAGQIAREWNTKDKFSGYVGYVIRMKVQQEYIEQYEEQTAGASKHKELWIPAEELEQFNRHLMGPVELVQAYYGELFTGWIPDEQRFAGKAAPEQLLDLHSLLKEDKETFEAVIHENKKTIYLHYHYWQQTDAASIGMEPAGKQSLLAAIKQCWQEAVPEIALLDSQG